MHHTSTPADQQHTPGGCNDCNAYQTVEQAAPGLVLLTVHHDHTCPSHHCTEGDHHD